jgi:hypothetical protein
MRHEVAMLAAEELSSVVVETHAVLAFACLDGQRHCARIESEVASESHGFGGRIVWLRYVTRVAIDQPVNAVVESPGQAPEDALGINRPGAISPACKNHFLFIGDAVVVRVLEIEQVRHGTDKESAPITMDGRGPAQALGKNGRLVKTAVAIGVFQSSDLSAVLFALRIIVHLEDEEPPVLVEGHRDGIGEQRFGGDEFEAKPFPELEGVQGIACSDRWKFWKFFRIGDPLLSGAQR